MRVYSIGEKTKEFENRLNYNYKLIYKVGCTTGLRISDIIKLEKSALKIERPTIKEQKTGKSKRIYIPRKLRKELQEYCKNNAKYVFESQISKTGHITRQAVFKHFKRIADELGIPQNIGTHTMRKNYAKKLLLKHKSYKYIKNKLNHDNLQDTLLYLIDEVTENE